MLSVQSSTIDTTVVPHCCTSVLLLCITSQQTLTCCTVRTVYCCIWQSISEILWRCWSPMPAAPRYPPCVVIVWEKWWSIPCTVLLAVWSELAGSAAWSQSRSSITVLLVVQQRLLCPCAFVMFLIIRALHPCWWHARATFKHVSARDADHDKWSVEARGWRVCPLTKQEPCVQTQRHSSAQIETLRTSVERQQYDCRIYTQSSETHS